MFQSRSAAAAQKTAVAQAPAPVQVRQSGLAPASNKVNIITAKSALPAAPFSSSSGYIDFEIPNTTGKLVDVQAEWTLAFSSVDASGTDVQAMPTSFFTQKVEILYDGESVETVEAQEAFQESIVWTTDQEYALNRTRWNISSAGNLNAAFNVAANSTVNKTWYQPLNANFLMRWSRTLRDFLEFGRSACTLRLTSLLRRSRRAQQSHRRSRFRLLRVVSDCLRLKRRCLASRKRHFSRRTFVVRSTRQLLAPNGSPARLPAFPMLLLRVCKSRDLRALTPLRFSYISRRLTRRLPLSCSTRKSRSSRLRTRRALRRLSCSPRQSSSNSSLSRFPRIR